MLDTFNKLMINLGKTYDRKGMQEKREEAEKMLKKYREDFDQEDPRIQARAKKASKVFCKIDTLNFSD